MNPSTFLFLVLSILCVLLQAFFSMMEMASVSFNRIRLYSFVKSDYAKAVSLKYLLDKPSRLFTTTLVLVNVCLLSGSEASRRFYESIHVNPDWAVVSQTFIVLMFGELVPLVIARNYPQHVAFFGVSLVVFFAKILSPIIRGIDLLLKKLALFSSEEGSLSFALSREEIPAIFEKKTSPVSEYEQMNQFVTTLFELKTKPSKLLMKGIDSTVLISSETPIEEAEKIFVTHDAKFLFVYHHTLPNIQSVLYPIDIIGASKEESCEKYGMIPWFVFAETPLLEILKQFPKSKQKVAILLGQQGVPIGYLTKERIVDLLLFPYKSKAVVDLTDSTKTVVQKNISASMTLVEFNHEFDAHLLHPRAKTIEELLQVLSQEKPHVGEVIIYDRFEFTILEASVREIKKVSVKTIT